MWRDKSIKLPEKGLALAGLLVLGLLCIMLWPHPEASGNFPPCPVRHYTGLLCPGCGTLRALHELLHGHFGAAFQYNPLTVIFLPFLLYAGVSRLSKIFFQKQLPRLMTRPWMSWGILLVVIVFGILRNV